MKTIVGISNFDYEENLCTCGTKDPERNPVLAIERMTMKEVRELQDKNSSTTSEPVTFALLKNIIWGDVKSTERLKSDSDRSA